MTWLQQEQQGAEHWPEDLFTFKNGVREGGGGHVGAQGEGQHL